MTENLLAGESGGPAWRFSESDANGEFVLEGLLAKDYRLRALDPATLLIGETDPVPAGSVEVQVKLDTDKLYLRVAGRVIDHQGKPVVGASVSPMCDAFRLKHEGRTLSTSHATLDPAFTDAEGRFELRNLPKSLVYLRIDGEDIVPLEYGRRREADGGAGSGAEQAKSAPGLPVDRIESMEVTVSRRCHFQVALADPEFADELCVLDEEGVQVELSLFAGTGRREGARLPIQAGRTEVIACPDNGVTLVLRKAGAEVLRRNLELVPGEVLQVRN
ncbi:MAG: carboxypeptidase regulatory-like domain-containing protein [Planctomycetes bacterium]|nr:carboxypeptidase regulatory-like domain-containing protein [Planctomycetota bacterium]